MPRLLVLQHVAWEILGTLDPLLRQSGFRIRYVNFDRHPHARPSLDGYHGLVVLGGPMNVDETDRYPHLDTERRLIETALERELPLLGICLGAQMVASVLGARVSRSPRTEIGWYDVSPTPEGRTDSLIGNFEPVERIFHWHGDMFDVPAGAVQLVESDDVPNQAFRYGDRTYGLQFHLEVDRAMIERWLRVPDNLEQIEALEDVCPHAIREETPRRIGRLHRLSDRTFSAFVDLFPRRRGKPRLLPSR